MADEEREKWEARYSDRDYHPRENPSALLVKWVDRLKPGRALDLACGTGRHALFLAERGFDVTAVDISKAAIAIAQKRAKERGLEVAWVVADLDSYRIHESYDVIVVFFYTNPALVPDITCALTTGGILIYEHHLEPSDPEADRGRHRFRFRPGELGRLFPSLHTLQYEEREVDEEGGRHSFLATLVAEKPSGLPV